MLSLNASRAGQALESASTAGGSSVAITVALALAGGLAGYALVMYLVVRLLRRGCRAQTQTAVVDMKKDDARNAGNSTPTSSSIGSSPSSSVASNEVDFARCDTPPPGMLRDVAKPSPLSPSRAAAGEWLARQELQLQLFDEADRDEQIVEASPRRNANGHVDHHERRLSRLSKALSRPR